MTNNSIISQLAHGTTIMLVFLFFSTETFAQKEYYDVKVKEDAQIISEDNKDTYFTEDSIEVYNVADEMPRFPGCEDLETKAEKHHCARKKLLEYVYGKLNYPMEARKKGIQGMVVVRFYIDTLGKVQNIEVVRDIGGGAGEAAQDVFKKMNEEDILWEPGKHNGKVVNVDYTMPIRFQLTSKNKN